MATTSKTTPRFRLGCIIGRAAAIAFSLSMLGGQAFAAGGNGYTTASWLRAVPEAAPLPPFVSEPTFTTAPRDIKGFTSIGFLQQATVSAQSVPTFHRANGAARRRSTE